MTEKICQTLFSVSQKIIYILLRHLSYHDSLSSRCSYPMLEFRRDFESIKIAHNVAFCRSLPNPTLWNTSTGSDDLIHVGWPSKYPDLNMSVTSPSDISFKGFFCVQVPFKELRSSRIVILLKSYRAVLWKVVSSLPKRSNQLIILSYVSREVSEIHFETWYSNGTPIGTYHPCPSAHEIMECETDRKKLCTQVKYYWWYCEGNNGFFGYSHV